MKKITIITVLLTLISWQTNAQFGCGAGIPITNGYTQMAIMTPGSGGVEDWNSTPTGTTVLASYWDADVYLFEYTAGPTTVSISMDVFSRNGKFAIGIFDNCTGTTLDMALDDANLSNIGGGLSLTVSAIIAPGNTVYIAAGQKGGVYAKDLDFDVTSFTVTPTTCPPPSALSATNLSPTSTDLGWTDNAGVALWDIEWGTVGFTPTGTPTITGTNTNPYPLTSLTAGASYDFYVRADCGAGGFSTWSGPYSYTTPCPALLPLPWSEGFENVGIIPNCWSMTGGEDWEFNNTGTGEQIGTNGMLSGTTTSNSYFAWVDASGSQAPATLTSPFIDLSSLTNPQLSFYEISDNEGDANSTLDVEVWDGAAWNNVGVYNTNTAGWEKKDIVLSALTFTGPAAVRFTFSETVTFDYKDDIAIDDVTFEEVPTCLIPSALTVNNITATSADMGWTDNAGVTLWDIEYGVSPYTTTGTPTIVGTNTNPHGLTGLTPETTYQFYVRADCGAGDLSAWTGPFSFTTPCTAFAVPFSENFSSTSISQNCWTVLNNNGDGDMWNMDYTSNTLAGDEVAVIYTFANGGANDDYLITPPLTLTGNQQLRFSYRVETAGSPNDLEVLLSTTGIGVGNFTTTLLPLEVFTNTTYAEKIIDLSAYVGNVNIAFHVPNAGSGGWRLYVDSVEIEITSFCPVPNTLTVSNVTSTSANLGWTSTGSVWDIELGTAGFAPTGTPTTTGTAANTHNLVGLTGNTSYDYYVRNDCGAGDLSFWGGPFNFTTSSVGINESANTLGLNIYPNPNKGTFSINIANLAESNSVTVYDMLGKVIMNKQLVATETLIDLTGNNKGVYFINIQTDNGTVVRKVILQ